MAERSRRVGALEVSPDGVVVYADGGARALLGEDIVGHSVDELAPEGHERRREGFALAPSSRVMGDRVVRARTLDGGHVWLYVGLTPISAGRVVASLRESVTLNDETHLDMALAAIRDVCEVLPTAQEGLLRLADLEEAGSEG